MTKQVRWTLGIIGGVVVVLSVMLLVMALQPTSRQTERLSVTIEPTLLQRPD